MSRRRWRRRWRRSIATAMRSRSSPSAATCPICRAAPASVSTPRRFRADNQARLTAKPEQERRRRLPDLRTWLKSGWLDLVISLLFAAVEAATIAPWLHLLARIFGDVNAPIPSPVGIWLVALVSFWAARSLIEGGW